MRSAIWFRVTSEVPPAMVIPRDPSTRRPVTFAGAVSSATSGNIIEASWRALEEGLVFGLLHAAT